MRKVLAILILSLVPHMALAKGLDKKPLVTVEVTPTLSLSPDYSAGDQMGASNELSSATLDQGGYAILKSISVLDKESQSQSIDVFLFSKDPGMSTVDNEAASLTDANAVSNGFLGVVNIPAANYKALGENSIASVNDIGLLLKAAPSSTSVFCILVARGTNAVATSTDLVVRFGIEQ